MNGVDRIGLIAAVALAGAVASGAGPASATPVPGLRELVFAAREKGRDGHWYANFGYCAQDETEKCYAAGGRICALDLGSGAVRVLVDDPGGSVRDPAVDHDGERIVFSWRKGGAETFHLWAANPDGTGQMIYFGNLHPGGVFIDAKPIPGSREVVLVNSPGHGRAEHAGRIAIVDPRGGPDEKGSMREMKRYGVLPAAFDPARDPVDVYALDRSHWEIHW